MVGAAFYHGNIRPFTDASKREEQREEKERGESKMGKGEEGEEEEEGRVHVREKVAEEELIVPEEAELVAVGEGVVGLRGNDYEYVNLQPGTPPETADLVLEGEEKERGKEEEEANEAKEEEDKREKGKEDKREEEEEKEEEREQEDESSEVEVKSKNEGKGKKEMLEVDEVKGNAEPSSTTTTPLDTPLIEDELEKWSTSSGKAKLHPTSHPPTPHHYHHLHKKTLTKHPSARLKYAPGDYTKVPNSSSHMSEPRSAFVADTSQLLYQSFIISGTVDHRLLSSLEFPAELQLQRMAKKEYEDVLVAMVTAAPALREGHEEEREEETGEQREGWRREEEEEKSGPSLEGVEAYGIEGMLEEACEMLRRALEELLSLSLLSRPSVDKMAVLQLWSEIEALLHSGKQATPTDHASMPHLHPSPSTAGLRSGHPSLSSLPLLSLLLLCLSSPPFRPQLWQLGLSLLHDCLTWCTTSPSLSPFHPSQPHTLTVPVHSSQLFEVLASFFLAGDMATEVGEGVVSDLFRTISPLMFTGSYDGVRGDGVRGDGVRGDGVRGDGVRGDGVRGDGVRGAHILLEVLVHVLEKR